MSESAAKRKRRVLFVDDEEDLLIGLKCTLRKARKQWSMRFACGGAEAIAMIKEEPVDAVITDMRMPGMDGAELLSWVRQICPDACRIILSGHADDSMAMRALPVAHQYLHKPCDRETIIEAVNRTCMIKELVQDEHIKRVIGETTTLPSSPRRPWLRRRLPLRRSRRPRRP